MSIDNVTISYERRPHHRLLGLHQVHALERKRNGDVWSVTFRSELSYFRPGSGEECKESYCHDLDVEAFREIVAALDACPMFVTPCADFALGVGGCSMKVASVGSTIEFHWLTLPESWTAVRYLCDVFERLIQQLGPLAQYERLQSAALLAALDDAAT